MRLQGEICVWAMVEDLRQHQREEERERAYWREWLARMQRAELRREEHDVLRAWWQAAEQDRPEVVRRYREVFDRIDQNRQRRYRIECEERRLVDAAMRRAGYVIRPARTGVRYVRPGWKGGDVW